LNLSNRNRDGGIVPEIGAQLYDFGAALLYELEVFCDVRVLPFLEDGAPVEGHIDIQDPVLFGELEGDVLTIASQFKIPGLKSYNYKVHRLPF
jgi:hypothetical protein